MTDDEIAIEREKQAILYSLCELKPFFEDDNVTDIFVNNCNDSIKEFGKPRRDVNLKLTNQQCLNIIIQIANHMGIHIHDEYPVLEGTVPYYDARITGIHRKWTKNPFITIRKKCKFIYTLDDYIKNKQISEDKAEKIRNAIKFKKNILISGGTGSGKTTLTNALINEKIKFDPNVSLFIVEDNMELQCNAKYAQFVNIETDEAMKAIKLSLRCSPDSIIFGEIRDGHVLWALLDAFNTGHPGGMSTIHANSAEGTFLRMRTLLKQAFGIEQPVNNLIDLIVHISKDINTGVLVDEIIETKDYTEKQIEAIIENSIESEF